MNLNEIINVGAVAGIGLFFVFFEPNYNSSYLYETAGQDNVIKDFYLEIKHFLQNINNKHYYTNSSFITFILSFALAITGLVTLIACVVKSYTSPSYMIERHQYLQFYLDMGWFTLFAFALSAVLILLTTIKDFIKCTLFWKAIYVLGIILIVFCVHDAIDFYANRASIPGGTLAWNLDNLLTPLAKNLASKIVYGLMGLPKSEFHFSALLYRLLELVFMALPLGIFVLLVYRLLVGLRYTNMYNGIVIYFCFFPALFTFIKYPLSILGMIIAFIVLTIVIPFVFRYIDGIINKDEGSSGE